MATFNTAFGSLPGYKEMMGTTNTTAGGEEKPPTVYGGQAQAQRKTQQPAQTFAQMQAQGQARPARSSSSAFFWPWYSACKFAACAPRICLNDSVS